MLHAARCKCRTQKSRQKLSSVHHPTTLSGYIFATKASIDNRKKKLVKQQYLLYMSSQYGELHGPLAAEIVSLVWGTPGNFNGFRVLAALLHGTLVVGVSQIAALNRGRHLYSAGRPSRWALAHILVMIALCNRANHYIFILFLSSFFFFLFFSSPNLSGRRLDVYHTLAHGVALVRI